MPWLGRVYRSGLYLQRRAEGRLAEFDYPYHPQVRNWDRLPGRNPYRSIIEKNDARYAELLSSFANYKDYFAQIPVVGSEESLDPFWTNQWLPPVDGVTIYGLLAKNNPRYFVEVGSGNSTKFAKRAIKDHSLRTNIISIDPHPRADIDQLCDRLIREKLENIDLTLFSTLGKEDIVFIDNSHRSFQASDVTVFFTEILPILGSGCVYGLHDIFLPNDYPAEWKDKFYNEQYLLMAYLLGGAGSDEVILPAAYVCSVEKLRTVLMPAFEGIISKEANFWGGGFWLRRGTHSLEG